MIKVYNASLFDELTATDFGFSQEELDQMLSYYSLLDHHRSLKNWYKGYTFGNQIIYNPWSLINFISDLTHNSSLEPISYWAQSSGNTLIDQYLTQANQNDYNRLLSGQSLIKEIKQSFTPSSFYAPNNIYSALLWTGYLTYTKCRNNSYELKIPNKEILTIYKQIDQENLNQKMTHLRPQLIENLRRGDYVAAMSNLTTFFHSLLGNEDLPFLLDRLLSDATHHLSDDCYMYMPTALNQPGFILKLMYTKDATLLNDASQKAIDYIHHKTNLSILKEQGYQCIHVYGLAYTTQCINLLMEE